MVIEQHIPEIPDRQTQLADGIPNLAGPGMVAQQPQRPFERQPYGEQPGHHASVHAIHDAVMILHRAQHHRRRVACHRVRGAAHRPSERLVHFRYRTVAGRD
jgi:hypothetical protein